MAGRVVVATLMTPRAHPVAAAVAVVCARARFTAVGVEEAAVVTVLVIAAAAALTGRKVLNKPVYVK